MAQKQNLGLADFWPSLLADQGPEKEKGAMPFLPLTTTAIAAVLPQEQRLCFVDLQNPQPVLEIFSGPQDFGQVVANQSIQDQDTANLKMDLLLRNKISRESLVLPPFTPSPLKPFLGAVQALQNRDYQGAAPYFDLAVNQAQGDEKNLALFFQYLNQYFILSPRRKKSWMALKEDLRTLRHKLPPALQDHVTLFILRINRLIDEKAAGPQLHSLALRRVWRYEQHLPPAIFLQVTRFLTQLRPDVLDVIYPHAI